MSNKALNPTLAASFETMQQVQFHQLSARDDHPHLACQALKDRHTGNTKETLCAEER